VVRGRDPTEVDAVIQELVAALAGAGVDKARLIED
jgi:hypothetical protein